MDEKQQFSERLKAAMAASGMEPKPSVLEKLFNLQYPGSPVSYQGVRRWLIGLSIPEQDKLETLAGLLGMDVQTLRYGRRPTRERVSEPRSSWPPVSDANDRVAIDVYLKLPLASRKAVREVIHALAAANPGKA